MENSPPAFPKPHTREGEEMKYDDKQFIISTLPSEEGVVPAPLRNYQGFWFPELFVRGIIAFQHHPNPSAANVFLASPPKAGSTWLKALTFAVATRTDYDLQSHPLLTQSPQDCVPLVEAMFLEGSNKDQVEIPCKVLSTHMPYSLLPEFLRSSHFRIIYVCRDPKDAFVSGWHYYRALPRKTETAAKELLPIAGAFDKFCEGVSPYGPIWDHVVEYWRASLERPDNVLFLKYEEVMEDPIETVRKLAEFLRQPFSEEEEKRGVPEGIVRLCSFDNLSNLQVNKNSVGKFGVKRSAFFRKGKVGDWQNHISKEMGQALDEIVEEKFAGSGLSLKSKVSTQRD